MFEKHDHKVMQRIRALEEEVIRLRNDIDLRELKDKAAELKLRVDICGWIEKQVGILKLDKGVWQTIYKFEYSPIYTNKAKFDRVYAFLEGLKKCKEKR
jgi:hypothetical protein